VSHGAVGIVLGDVQEFLFGFLIPEGVQQRDAALERLLHQSGAGNGEMDGSELGLVEIFVVMVIFLVVVGGGGERWKDKEQGKRQ